jgi:hypothetical protein
MLSTDRRRFRLRAPLVASMAIAALAPAAALAAPALVAPAKVAVDAHVTVHASGLEPGRYSALLVKIVEAPKSQAATGCSGRIGRATVARDGRVTIAGKLPGRLGCSQGAGPVTGHISTSAGRYELELGVLQPPGIFGAGSLLRRSITLTN